MATSNLLEEVRKNLEKVNDLIHPEQRREESASRSRGRGNRKKATEKAKEVTEPLDSQKLSNALAALQSAVCDLAEVVKSSQEASTEASTDSNNSRVRQAEDDLDEEKQRNLRGKFIITSSDKDGKESHFKSDETLKADKKDLVDHVIDLAEKKYKVKIPKTDFASCSRIHNGGIIFHLWNQKPESAYSKLCKNIKSRVNLDLNIYFNFMLTKRRSTLLFEARKLKRSLKITKFLSDETGAITIQKDETKEKIASKVDKDSGQVKTWTVKELLDRFNIQPQPQE